MLRSYIWPSETSRTRLCSSRCSGISCSRVSKAACSSVLDALFDDHHANSHTVRLLLRKGANVPRKGIALACASDRAPLFRVLCQYSKLADMVVEEILKGCDTEAKALQWLKVWAHKRPSKTKLAEETLFFLCLQQFPDGANLLSLLLENGLPVPAMVSHCTHEDFGTEQCTTLIWALLSKPRIATGTIMVLLKRSYDGGEIEQKAAEWSTNDHTGSIDYCTPKSQISAALVCLLDPKRTPILRALRCIDREMIADYRVPASTPASLAGVGKDEEADIGSQNLRIAALYLGNFDAFKLLNIGDLADEGLLHLTALLALPRFVERLLRTHDPNQPQEEYDNYILLAVAIESTTPSSWCKIANEEADFFARRKKTIEILARQTDLTWRHRGRTVVHFALEQGPEMTMMLLDALDLRDDPQRYEKLKYTDKAGRVCQPHEYVAELMKEERMSKENGLATLGCLKMANLLPGGASSSSSSWKTLNFQCLDSSQKSLIEMCT